MKKILSLALVFTMVLTMSVTAFAANINQDSEDKTGTTDITYTVSDSYIVTIPDSMTIGTDATVSVKDVVLAKDYDLAVSVSSKNNWKLKNAEVDSIDYTLKIGDTTIANNGMVLNVKSGETATKTLVTAVPKNQKPKYSGSYTDTLTFTVAVAYSYDAITASADELKTALAEALQAGETNIMITMSATPEAKMFTAIRRALIDTEGVADGSINLTLKGVTTIPDHDEMDSNTAIFGSVLTDKNGNYLDDPECVTQLKSVNLPDVLTIGDYAFQECQNLTVLTAPKVQTVGEKAFPGCENLTVLTAPKVQTIGEDAFSQSNLTSVDLPEATTIGNLAFFGTKATEFYLPKVTVLGDQTLDFVVFNNEVTIYLTSADEIKVHKDCFYLMNLNNSLATKVNLVLNDNKQSQVSGNTWTTNDNNGDEVSFTFKSITFED